MPKRVKALTNFYSQEFGSVTVGDELQVANQSTMDDLMKAGYVEEIGTITDGSIAPENATASMPQATATRKAVSKARARKGAADVEFGAEMGATSISDSQTAQANAVNNAQATSSTFNNEFAEEMGATPNEMGKATKSAQAKAQANKVNDNE